MKVDECLRSAIDFILINNGDDNTEISIYGCKLSYGTFTWFVRQLIDKHGHAKALQMEIIPVRDKSGYIDGIRNVEISSGCGILVLLSKKSPDRRYLGKPRLTV